MGGFKDILPLVVLFTVLGFGAFIGYHLYVWSNEMADRGRKKMEKKNLTFTKDGMKVGVKDLSAEEFADRQQNILVRAWNSSSMPNYKSRFWNKEEQARQRALAQSGASPRSSSNLPSSSETVRANNGLNIPSSSRPVARRAGSSNVGAFPEE